MALKRYIKTTAASGGDTTITVGANTYQVFYLVAVAATHELAAVNMRIIGGASGGELHLLTYRGGNIVEDTGYTVSAGDVAIIDAKEFYEAGDTVAIYATSAGMTVALSADYSATE